MECSDCFSQRVCSTVCNRESTQLIAYEEILLILNACSYTRFQAVCITGDATVKGYTKLINKTGAYTEIANTGTDEKRCKEL